MPRAYCDNTQVRMQENIFCVLDVKIQEESKLPFTSFGKEERKIKVTEENVEGNAIPSAERDEKSASSNWVSIKMKILAV